MLRNSIGRRFQRGWIGASFIASLSFFSKIIQYITVLALNDNLNCYFNSANLYHNYFMDYSISAFLVYQFLHRWLSKIILKLNLTLGNQELLLNLTSTQLRLRAQKYSLFLCLFGLFTDTFLHFKRKQLILASINNNHDCPYALSDDDLILLKRLVKAQ